MEEERASVWHGKDVIVYCDVVNVQPQFNFSDEIIK